MYHLLYQKVLWPAYELLIKRRHTCRRWQFLERSQWWDPNRMVDFQKRELAALLKHHYQRSAWFRELCSDKGIEAGDLERESAFSALPIMSKDDIRRNLERMKAEPPPRRVYSKATGGSTGQPLHFCHDEVSYEWRMAAAFRAYSWAGCEDGRKTVYIWGGPMGDPAAAGSLKEKLHQRIQGRRVFNSFHFDEEKMLQFCQFIRHYRPDGIVGYTNALCSLARFIQRRKLETFSIHGIITAAEGVDQQQRDLLESVFGGRVFQTYGSREFMSIGAECDRHNGLHIAAENLIVEIIRDGRVAEPGEAGEIVVTDLHNYAMPFIRYRIGDMGTMKAGTCSCGRGLPMLGSVAGRQLDILRTADGREVPGEFFPHLMKEFKSVERFQVLQKSKNLIELRLQAPSMGAESEVSMKSQIRKVFGELTEVKLCYMDEIPLTQSGKFRVTISEVEA